MLTKREHNILEVIRNAGGSCSITSLAEHIGVTDETIRRNLKPLEESAHVKKVHGGVQLAGNLEEPPFNLRMEKNAETKQRLAKHVAGMIKEGDSLFLDIGSTTAYVAQALKNHKNLYIVTNSVSVAYTLASLNNNRVFLSGGELRPHDGGSFGTDAIQFIRRFNLDYAIFSVGAINAKAGFMLHDVQEADLSAVASQCAETCIVVADSDKFGRRAPIVVQNAHLFDYLVTDQSPVADIVQLLADHDITVLLPDT